jgi:membrane-associated phospholipid phosphatase
MEWATLNQGLTTCHEQRRLLNMNVEWLQIGKERKFYIKVTLIVYLLWIIFFEVVGWYAVKLPTHDITSWVDRKIPLIPQFIWPYMLCYIFPLLPLVAIKDLHRLNRTLLSVIIANLSAFILYLIFPVAFPRPELSQGLSEHLLSYLYHIDFHPGANKLPSLHVTFAWIVYLACQGQRLGKFGHPVVFLIAMLITISALFVKQHVIADVVIGIGWALASWSLAANFYKSLVDPNIEPRAGLKQMMRKVSPILITFAVIIFSMFFF